MTSVKVASTNQINKRAISTKCPVTFTLHKMGGRWKPLIINSLLGGTKRYSELRKAIPNVTEKMLIQNLKELEADELISRVAQPIVPPHVAYSLTACGRDLAPVFQSMYGWASKYNV